GRGGPVAVWTSRVPRGLDARAARAGVALRRVEDGFVRSVGLGSDLLPPSSVVVDARGIYFDPSRPSDLETLLHDTSFDATLRQRAGQLRALLVARGVSKYGMGSGAAEAPGIRCPDDRRVIVVPGQVGDDLSIRLGAQPGLGVVRDNLALVQAVRAENPDAYVIFRPHPDVDAGHRKGAVPDAEVLRHADQIARGGPMTALITLADEVHTMTSLAGFEALLRGRAVTAYGTPFYAGWGLTQDRAPATGRRGKPLHPDDLVAGALVLYPLYLDPLTRLPCGPEVLVSRLADPALWRPSLAVRIRRLQGRLRHTFANLVARRSRS
ncbi:capsular polysaccharide export protein, LipB/KpsS family, partial [Ameyamaea chiangmaiensis]|nr:hypothetical protein [Ameyamaea chiangmaiensis]